MKYIDAELLRKEIEFAKSVYSNPKRVVHGVADAFRQDGRTAMCDDILKKLDSLQQEQDMGEVSDGYHTFNELYCYRMLYNAAFFNLLPKGWVHKSKRHHTGEECFGGGWFIVMANLPTGQVSNHYELKDWDLFQVPEKEIADKWDGHTPQEAAKRLYEYLQQKQQGELFEYPETPIKNAIEVTSRMKYIDEELKPIAEFIMDYASWNLHKNEWNQPTLEVPLFRVLDALVQKGKPYCCAG